MIQRTLTNSNFDIFAQEVSAPSLPDEYNSEAVRRLMERLAPYVVDVKGVRFKHHAINKIELINFTTPQEMEAYKKAWDNHVNACLMLENRFPGGEGRFLKMVQKNKFVQAAELIRAPYLAKRAYESALKKNRSLIVAVKHKETISKMVKIMTQDYGVSRDKIALVWGGLTGTKVKKTKKRQKEMSLAEKKRLLEMFSGPDDLEMLTDMGLDVEQMKAEILESEGRGAELVVSSSEMADKLSPIDRSLRFGPQNAAQRQAEIDAFQNEKAQWCFFTFKSGGVGLSLQQDEEWKRTRETLLAPTYSGIEMVQALGRAEGLPACSDTEQTMVLYDGTVEVEVADAVGRKLKCLREVVRQRQSWEAAIYDGALRGTYTFQGRVGNVAKVIGLDEAEVVDEIDSEEEEETEE